METCRQANEAIPADTRLKIALSKALWHAQGRPASLPPLREAIARGDTTAMLALFNDYECSSPTEQAAARWRNAPA